MSSSKSRRGGGERGREAPSADGVVVDKRIIESIKEATGAGEDDVRIILAECGYDANEATARLIDNPFSQVQSKKDKKKKRDEDRKQVPVAKVMEVPRRNSSQGGRSRGHDRERGPRGDRGDRGDRGSRTASVPTVAPLLPAKPAPAAAPEAAASGWEAAASESDQLNGSAPVAADSLAAAVQAAPPQPIRPPGAAGWGAGGGKSMADLFKQRPAEPPRPAPVPQPPAPAPVATVAPDPPAPAPVKQEAGPEANGWGALHTSGELESLRAGGSLGGVAISAPQKSHGSQPLPIQAGGGGSGLGQTPVGSQLSSVPASPGRSQQHIEEQVSSTGLGGLPVEAPPRQSYSEGPAAGWGAAPKAPQAPAPAAPTLGSSILSSLGSQADPLAPPQQQLQPQPPQQQQPPSELGLGHSPIVLPPGAQQGGELGGLSFQFGQFGLGGGDAGAFSSASLGSAFQAAPSSTPSASSELPASAAADALRAASYGQPGQPQQASQQQQQQQQQQRAAYTAFAAVQPQLQQQGKPGEQAASQALYGSQAYPGYGAGYGQYAAPAQYQAYGFQAPAETAQAPAASAAQQQQQQQQAGQQQAGTGAKRPQGYDNPGSYGSYAQQQQPGQGQQQAPGKEFQQQQQAQQQAQGQAQAQRYGQAQAQGQLGGNPGAAGQAQLSQVAGGYGAGQVGGMPQGYGAYGAGQQFAGYGHPGAGYGYASAGYNYGGQAGYGSGGGAYGGGQGNKYGRAGYGGGGYQQHVGGYGAQQHKQEKDHQAAHLGAHDLYAQQQGQLPLGGQQHQYPAGLREPYGYAQAPGQQYGGYGMGQRYNQPY